MTLEEIHQYIEEDKDFDSIVNHAKILSVNRNNFTPEDNERYTVDQIALHMQFDSRNNKFDIIRGLSRTLELSEIQNSYLETRLKYTKNPIYYFNYSYLYYIGNNKNQKKIKKGIEKYILYIESAFLNYNQEHSICDSCLGLIFISTQFKHQEIEIIELISNNIQKLSTSCQCIITNYISESKINIGIKKSFYNKLNETYLAKNETITHFSTKANILETLIKLYKKTNNTTNVDLCDALGELYLEESEIKSEGQQKEFFYLAALNFFKISKNTKKIETTLKLIEDNKRHIKFTTVPFRKLLDPYKKERVITVFKEIDDLLKNKDSNSIYNYIISSKNLIPSERSNKSILDSELKGKFKIVNYDSNNNQTKSGKSLSEYGVNTLTLTSSYLKCLFIEGIQLNLITYKSLYAFLVENAWFSNLDEDNFKIDWLQTIGPSLELFFDIFKTDCQDLIFSETKYIPAIDSLTMKFEGLFRDFLIVNGTHSLSTKKDEVIQNISIDKILKSTVFISKVPENNLAFFEYLFTKEGLDLRNNIGHAFYNYNKYNFIHFILLITALLRFGSIKIEE